MVKVSLASVPHTRLGTCLNLATHSKLKLKRWVLWRFTLLEFHDIIYLFAIAESRQPDGTLLDDLLALLLPSKSSIRLSQPMLCECVKSSTFHSLLAKNDECAMSSRKIEKDSLHAIVIVINCQLQPYQSIDSRFRYSGNGPAFPQGCTELKLPDASFSSLEKQSFRVCPALERGESRCG